MATDGTDDVALFDITCEEHDQTWTVPTFLSPLFRLVRMKPGAPAEERQEMVAGLGARAIVERLEQGMEPSEKPVVFALDYPGAPGDPDLLLPYEEMTVCIEEGQKNVKQQV